MSSRSNSPAPLFNLFKEVCDAGRLALHEQHQRDYEALIASNRARIVELVDFQNEEMADLRKANAEGYYQPQDEVSYFLT
jgi:hypothetical protein